MSNAEAATAPPVLGANPFVPLTRGPVAAALGPRDVEPRRGDKRFSSPAFRSNGAAAELPARADLDPKSRARARTLAS